MLKFSQKYGPVCRCGFSRQAGSFIPHIEHAVVPANKHDGVVPLFFCKETGSCLHSASLHAVPLWAAYNRAIWHAVGVQSKQLIHYRHMGLHTPMATNGWHRCRNTAVVLLLPAHFWAASAATIQQ
eukprot:GHUV01037635.1.p2 GENE.GHUV01037635.1~~GHUV01037635.1.p2  ORF type:complete len:126 (+),score=24.10 GHUV01037635.1:913-1290(+)